MTRGRLAILLIAALLPAACQTVTPTAKKDTDSAEVLFGGGTASDISANTPVSSAPRLSEAPTMDWSDPCSNNLQEVMGAILLYYRIHGELPASLDLLPPTSPAGEKISLSCAKSGKPYLYYPQGLRAPPEMGPEQRGDGTFRERSRLILVDPSAVHEMVQHMTDGKKTWDQKKMIRHAISMEPIEPNRPIKLYFVPVEDALLQMYIRSTQQETTGDTPPVETGAPRPKGIGW